MQLPSEVLNKIVNIGGMSNRDLWCRSCSRVTEHIQISVAEAGDGSTPSAIVGSIIDYIPLMGVFTGNPFTCKNCGEIRSVGGLMSGLMNRKGLGKRSE